MGGGAGRERGHKLRGNPLQRLSGPVPALSPPLPAHMKCINLIISSMKIVWPSIFRFPPPRERGPRKSEGTIEWVKPSWEDSAEECFGGGNVSASGASPAARGCLHVSRFTFVYSRLGEPRRLSSDGVFFRFKPREGLASETSPNRPSSVGAP